MAYTRIHNIKNTLPKAIEYICNPEKTEHSFLVSAYNCEAYSAAFEFRATAALGRELKGDYTRQGGADNLAHHMIQSFSPYDRITPEQAHELGKKWADEILDGRYEYVIATHIDKGHIHNHIIFNSVSYLDYKKFNNYKVAARLREVSDRLCIENGLYVKKYPNLKKKSMSHYEWSKNRSGNSWKAQIRNILNEAILQTEDWDSFLSYIHDKGVEVKDGKRISFRLIGTAQDRFCRGDRIHGGDYSRDGILALLKLPQNAKETQLSLSVAALVSKADQFAAYVEGEAAKVSHYNLQDLLDTLATIKREEIASTSDFDVCLAALDSDIKSSREKIDQLKELNHSYTSMAKFLVVYHKYKLIKETSLQKTGLGRIRFSQIHADELSEFDYAATQLEENGVMANADPEKVIEFAKSKLKNVSDLERKIDLAVQRAERIRDARNITFQILANARNEQSKHPKRHNTVR